MSIAAGHPRVPSEFIGRARQLCAAVAADERQLGVAIDAATRPIRERLRYQDTLRSCHRERLFRAWRDLPRTWCIADEVVSDRKARAWLLSGYWLAAASWSIDDWTE
jgi:hypothetical protein